MDLKIPSEPLKSKEIIRRGLQAHRDLEIANLKQGTWIASPLWSDVGWGKELKKYGFTWQKFMGIVRDHYPYFYDWIKGNASWEKVTRKLIERVEDEIKAMED